MTTKFLKKTSNINNSLEFTDSDWNMFMMMFMFIIDTQIAFFYTSPGFLDHSYHEKDG